MKVGDLIKWTEYYEKQYVPCQTERTGVVLKIAEWVAVLALNGEKIILYPQDTDIEVINESR